MAQTVYEIPLQSTPQVLQVALGAQLYSLNIQWNWASQTWTLDINETDGTPVITGIPLVTGVDLLAQFAYMEFGVGLEVQTDHDTYALPTFDNLGQTSHLYMVVTDGN